MSSFGADFYHLVRLRVYTWRKVQELGLTVTKLYMLRSTPVVKNFASFYTINKYVDIFATDTSGGDLIHTPETY